MGLYPGNNCISGNIFLCSGRISQSATFFNYYHHFVLHHPILPHFKIPAISSSSSSSSPSACSPPVSFIPLSNPPLPRPAGCVTFPTGYTPSLEEACSEMDKNQALITMFNENYVPKNCRSAIEGVWHFAYQNRFR